MKSARQAKILELIQKNKVETQEDLSEMLTQEGFSVTQATVSRDIRELKLTKVSDGGRQKYAVLAERNLKMSSKYNRVLKEGFVSMDTAQNILVIKTVSGMAMAVAAALDHLDCDEIVGSIAGDDTIMCAVRTIQDVPLLMQRLRKLLED